MTHHRRHQIRQAQRAVMSACKDGASIAGYDAERFAALVWRRVEAAIVQRGDGRVVITMTPDMQFEALQEMGACWMCGSQPCAAHPIELQRMVFEAQRESMQPFRLVSP